MFIALSPRPTNIETPAMLYSKTDPMRGQSNAVRSPLNNPVPAAIGKNF